MFELYLRNKLRKLRCYTTWSLRHFYRYPYNSEFIEVFVNSEEAKSDRGKRGEGNMKDSDYEAGKEIHG